MRCWKQEIMMSSFATGSDLSTHKAILELAKTKSGKIRLVTTNVDQGFELADPLLKGFIDSAPKLPVPKPHKWYSLVHLHGIINDAADPNGENFVFTSGDFGIAYLTERWASRFVGELFRNFTVLFIGYDVNDPVIRYMTDAIAAERRKGGKHFLKPYVLAATQHNKRETNYAAWEAKGVEPILYNAGTKHTYFHHTLKRWAADCRDGLRAKERIIKINSQIPPLPPFNDDQTIQIIDTLKERSDKNMGSVTGIPARYFAEQNPVPPIDWLPALHKNGLFDLCAIPDQCYAFSLNPPQANLVKPNSISRWIWEWLARHLESESLVHWTIDHGACLHPELSNIIKNKLTGAKPPKEPFFLFWKIVTSSLVFCDHPKHLEIWDLRKAFNRDISYLDLQKFISLLSPKINFSKPFRWPREMESEAEKRLFDAEILVPMGDASLFEEIKKQDNYPDIFIPILYDISLSLKRAMELQQIIGHANPQHDRSHWDQPSISPHDQNKRYHRWVILIELCCDVWQAAWNRDKSIACAALAMWKTVRFPVFRRLVFHAYTAEDVVTPSEALDYLFEDDGWWLWAIDIDREKYRLLNKIWPQLTDHGADKLVEIIISGLPREMYRDDLSSRDWHYHCSRSVWKLLSKLVSFGKALNKVGQSALEQISKQYPGWQLRGDDRDEFSQWMEGGSWGGRKVMFPWTRCLFSNLLNSLKNYWKQIENTMKDVFRFLERFVRAIRKRPFRY